jgi:Kdo2-lipid IVA lauroyltransferase/acyltransferase
VAALFLSSAVRKRIDRLGGLRRARWAIEAGLLGLFWQVCALLEPRSASAFGQALLGAIGPRLTKSEHVRRNLELAFPDVGARERDALGREIWAHAGAVLGEYPHFKTICHDDFDGHFEFVEK